MKKIIITSLIFCLFGFNPIHTKNFFQTIKNNPIPVISGFALLTAATYVSLKKIESVRACDPHVQKSRLKKIKRQHPDAHQFLEEAYNHGNVRSLSYLNLAGLYGKLGVQFKDGGFIHGSYGLRNKCVGSKGLETLMTLKDGKKFVIRRNSSPIGQIPDASTSKTVNNDHLPDAAGVPGAKPINDQCIHSTIINNSDSLPDAAARLGAKSTNDKDEYYYCKHRVNVEENVDEDIFHDELVRPYYGCVEYCGREETHYFFAKAEKTLSAVNELLGLNESMTIYPVSKDDIPHEAHPKPKSYLCHLQANKVPFTLRTLTAPSPNKKFNTTGIGIEVVSQSIYDRA